MQFLVTVFYFVVTLGVLVLVHEFGHFVAAKLSGMRVDRFSIGFPPRAFGKQIGDTDYCVGWLPIGGFVKIAGMIDESFDTQFLARSPEPWEFRSKPIWQRILVISAGVIMNVFLAILIFWGINYTQGKAIRNTTELGYVVEGSPASHAGLQAKDKILKINNEPVDHWDLITSLAYFENASKDLIFVVQRNGKEMQLLLPRSAIPEPSQSTSLDASFGIVPPHIEIVVMSVESGKPADKLGFRPNDIILSFNGTPLLFDKRVNELVQANADKEMQVEWKRGEQRMSGTITPTKDGRIGISFAARYAGPVTRAHYSLLGAFPAGVTDVVNLSRLAVQQLWQMVTGKVAFAKSVAGPIKIAQMATQTAELGIITYLGFMALLSMSLAILNILPFPALDGGHLLFLVYEGIFRREIPARIKIGLQKAGFVLLLAFMVFVVYNDIINF
jgi:regulator of sigma E protease